MFYSHEILHDRQYGVATIWLVATLGSKSLLKKITRKAIMEVNVPNACGTITDPSSPIALRLQGNLLFGVSRVFSQQCGYVLTDMQSLRDKMRGIQTLLKQLETDPGVSDTRPEQLNLQADAGFDVDLDIGFDLSAFDVSFLSSEPSSLLSPRTLASSQTSILEDEQMLELGHPLEVSSSYGAAGGLDLDMAGITSASGSAHGVSKPISEQGLDRELDVAQESFFDIDADGDIILHNTSDQPRRSELDVDSFEAVEGQDDFQLNVGDDSGQPRQSTPRLDSDGLQNFFDAEEHPQSDRHPIEHSPTSHPIPSDQQLQQSIEHEEPEQEEQETETVTGVARQRTVRTKTVPIDIPAELHNRVLGDWNTNYLEYMEAAHIENAGKLSVAQAKRNAAFWVLDQGIGGISTDFRDDLADHPLAIFSGQALLDALLNPQAQTSRKRTRNTTDDEDEQVPGSRRVRSRSQQEEILSTNGGDAQPTFEDDQGITLGEDEFEPQIGREEPAPMSDRPDAMPWNTYASSKGSRSRHGSIRAAMSIAGLSSSAGGRAAFEIGNLPSSLGSRRQRLSRLIPESPLEQRRRLFRQSSSANNSRRGIDDDADGSSINEDNFLLGDMSDTQLDRRLAANMGIRSSADFELYGPAALVSTQQAADPDWLAATLEQEAFNFLGFLQTTLREKLVDLAAGGDIDEDERDGVVVTFEELLPPAENSEIVAAQAFLHVLSLATKGLVTVRQDEDFGGIELGVVGGVGSDE